MTGLNEAGVAGADLELTAGGRRLRFPAMWLRDNCPCPQCQDPGSGQKLKDITDMPNDVGVAASARRRVHPGDVHPGLCHDRRLDRARHLQGCYADLDGLASTLAVLKREETP